MEGACPDGLKASFFHNNWELIPHDCYAFVRVAWLNLELVARISATEICLLPKVTKP